VGVTCGRLLVLGGALVAAAALTACSADAAGAPADQGDSGSGIEPDGAPLPGSDGGGDGEGGGGGDGGPGHDATVDSAPPEPPGVRFVGRVDTSDGKGTRFEWPGVSLHARFTGTSVSIDLEDSNASELAVFVDGTEHPKLVAKSGRQTYPLATGLAAGTHELEVWRRSEANIGLSEFFGLTFAAGGQLLAPPPALARRIEIVGDSITCGYGNEGQPGCTFSADTENNYLAYGSVAARAVNAELSTVAWSGLGMYRNYNDVGPSAKPLPYYYDDALPSVPTPWDFTRFVPDVVVINLGTNDSSTHGDPGQPFIDAYVAFIHHLRSKYPNAWIVCLDATTAVTNDIKQVVSTFTGAGDTKVEAFALTGQNGSGCDGHPNVASDALMGASLATELKRVMGW
jgi:lysophospholipase L1-like esterase